jgi:hypothetical protein
MGAPEDGPTVQGTQAVPAEIVERLNDLLEWERGGVEVAMGLAASETCGLTRGPFREVM